MSLRWRILLISVVCVSVILGLLSFFGISASKDSTEQTLAERLVLCEQVAHNLDFNIQQASRQINALFITGEEGGLNSEVEQESLLRDIRRLLAFNIQYVCLVDDKGKVMASEPLIDNMVGSNIFEDNDGMSSIFETSEPVVTNAIYDSKVDKYIAYLIVPVVSPENGSSPMLICAAIGLPHPSIGILANISEIGKSSYVEIVDESGMVLASNNPDTLLSVSDHGGVFAQLIQDGKSEVSTCHGCHGSSDEKVPEKEIITFAPLSTAPWGVVVRQSEEEALANTRLLQERLIIFGVIALLVILPLVWFVTRSITIPVNKLTLASRKIAKGGLDEPVSIQGKDEISLLAQSFDTMRLKLRDSIEKNKQRTTELEGLNAIALSVSQSLDLDAVLNGTLKTIMGIINVEIGGVLLLDEKAKKLSYRILQGFSEKFIEKARDIELNGSIEGNVAKTGVPIIIDDINSEPTFANSAFEEEHIKAFVCYPLRSKDKIVGILILASHGVRSFTTSDSQLLPAIANQISIAIENAKLYEDLRKKEEMLSELLKNSISAQEEERKRIARELHDETCQALTTLAIGLETISKSPPSDTEHLTLALRKNQNLIIKILDDIQRLILDLRPSILDDMGLITALQWYAKNRLEPEGIAVCVETMGTERRLPTHIEIALFRIAQEAISNIAQHSKAETASISLEFNANNIELTIEDDGIGFDGDKTYEEDNNNNRGFGMLGIMERVETLGGEFSINSREGQGTQIKIEIPLIKNGDRNE